MAEVHVIGELVGAHGFESASLFCKWGFVTGAAWKSIEGDVTGQTHIDNPYDDLSARWGHPIGLPVRYQCLSYF
jgi:B9 domain-containing protein 2